MIPRFSLVSLLPEGGKAFAAGLHPEMLQAWLNTLSGAPQEELALALQGQLKRIGVAANIRLRLKMLDIIAGETRGITDALEAELNQARHPLSTALQRHVVVCNELLKLLAKCYRAVAEKLSGRWIGRGNSRPLRHALTQAMETERERLLLAFRAYTPGPKSAWRNLHRLYRIARAEEKTGKKTSEDSVSPRSIYIKTLLLGLAEPVQMAPGELDRIRFYLERHAGLAELHDALGAVGETAAREGCFLIRLNEEGPGRSLQKWHNVEIQNGDLLLDCGQLLKRLQSQIDALALGALPAKIGLPAVARRPQYAAMMNDLLIMWSAPPLRRFSRQHFKPRVELAVGLNDLWLMLSGHTFKRRRDDRSPSDPKAQPELSEWSVINESPTGFALQYLSGGSDELSVDALVGLRSLDRSRIHVCMVRRLVSGEQRRAELGLQKYAPLAVPTIITWGGSATENKDSAKAVVLPSVPGLGNAAAVIAAPGLLQSGKRVMFPLEGKSMTLITGAPIERSASYEIFSLGKSD